MFPRFITADPHPSIYPDGMNRYAGYHIMHGGVDPTGEKWKINRDGGFYATAVPEVGDTLRDLADDVKLNWDEVEKWLTWDCKGALSGLNGEDIAINIDSPVDENVLNCCKLKVPNTPLLSKTAFESC